MAAIKRALTSSLCCTVVFGKPNVQALSNSEALYILSAVEQTRKVAEPNFVPTPMVQQTKQYLERFNSVKNKAATDAMRA